MLTLARRRSVPEAVPHDLVPKPIELPTDQEELTINLYYQSKGCSRYTTEELVYIAQNGKELDGDSKRYLIGALFIELLRGSKPHVLLEAIEGTEHYNVRKLPIQGRLFDDEGNQPAKQEVGIVEGLGGNVFSKTLEETRLPFALHPDKNRRTIAMVHASELELAYLTSDVNPEVIRDATLVLAIRAVNGIDSFKSGVENAASKLEREMDFLKIAPIISFGGAGLFAVIGIVTDTVGSGAGWVAFMFGGFTASIGAGIKYHARRKDRNMRNDTERI